MRKDDYRKYGVLGTITFHGVLLIMLLLVGFQGMELPEEGLLVNFGDSDTGSGLVEPMGSGAVASMEEESTPPPASPPPAKSKPEPEEESVNTQDFEEAAALKEEKKKQKEKVNKENEAKRQADLEAKRLRDEEIRQQREAEEAERKRQDALAKQAAAAQSAVKNAFAGKGTGTSTSEGNTTGSGNQGKLTGDPNSTNREGSGTGSRGTGTGGPGGTGSRGSGFDLSGRSLVGKLNEPSYPKDEYGVVVVEITVDRNGNVINAVPQLKGTTIQDNDLWRVATEAARKTKFNADPNATANQIGKITYHFNME
ncbi:MAG: energy transducer TonB [Breznakibacter sp.]